MLCTISRKSACIYNIMWKVRNGHFVFTVIPSLHSFQCALDGGPLGGSTVPKSCGRIIIDAHTTCLRVLEGKKKNKEERIIIIINILIKPLTETIVPVHEQTHQCTLCYRVRHISCVKEVVNRQPCPFCDVILPHLLRRPPSSSLPLCFALQKSPEITVCLLRTHAAVALSCSRFARISLFSASMLIRLRSRNAHPFVIYVANELGHLLWYPIGILYTNCWYASPVDIPPSHEDLHAPANYMMHLCWRWSQLWETLDAPNVII